MLFQMCTKLTFGLSHILVIIVIARNRIYSVGSFFFCDRILRFGKNMLQSLKSFLSNFKECWNIGSFTFCCCYSFLSSPSWLKMSLIYSRKYMLSNYRSEKFKQHCNHSYQWCIVKWLLLLSCLKWFLFVSLLSLLSYNLN